MNTSLKTCFRCGIQKPMDDFYDHPRMGDGKLNKCAACTRMDSEQRRARLRHDPEWASMEAARQREKARKARETQPHKVSARAIVTKAVRSGALSKHPCAICGNPKTEAHHEDYDKPLDVIWLCRRHHTEADIARRKRLRIAAACFAPPF